MTEFALENEDDERSSVHTRRSSRRAAARAGRQSIRSQVGKIRQLEDEIPEAARGILAAMDDEDEDDEDYVVGAHDGDYDEESTESNDPEDEESEEAAEKVWDRKVAKKRREHTAKTHFVRQVQVRSEALLVTARPCESGVAKEAGRIVVVATRRA